MLAQGFADAAPARSPGNTAVYAVATSVSYFALQTCASWLTAGTLPPPPAPGPLEWALIALAVGQLRPRRSRAGAVPLWAHHPAAAGLRVHLANGFYANAVFDRLVGGWSVRSAS